MIFKGSRYVKTPIIAPLDEKGRNARSLSTRQPPETPAVYEHTVLENERFDQIAAKYYGDAKKYWLIWDANPDVLHPMELLQPGRKIRIPPNQV